MRTLIKNGKVVTSEKVMKGCVAFTDGVIDYVGTAPVEADEIIDAEGGFIVPGFIDTHTHGAVGVDVNGATAEDLEKISCFMASKGTTSWLCSVLTDTQEQTEWCIEQFKLHQKMEQQHFVLLLKGWHFLPFL